jgi:hypothetical protein
MDTETVLELEYCYLCKNVIWYDDYIDAPYLNRPIFCPYCGMRYERGL